VLVKELQAIAINLDGAPGVRLDKIGCKAALKIDPPSASNIDPSEKCKKVSFCA
jgi:hypothetical protein